MGSRRPRATKYGDMPANYHDGYTGFKTYTFLFRGENVVDIRLPLPGEEMN
jgi:hypothetical protein